MEILQMRRILINAINVVGSGSQSICLSLLPELMNQLKKHRVRVLIPDNARFRALTFPSHVEVLFFKRASGWRNDIARLRELLFTISKHAKEMNADICLSLGDLGAVRLPCPQVVFAQNSLFVYTLAEIGHSKTWGGFKRMFLTWYFRHSMRSTAAIVVQTPVMKKRVLDSLSVESQRVSIISQPAPLHVSAAALPLDRNSQIDACKKPLKLLFLAQGYPHKNHGILQDVVKELRRTGLSDSVQIFTTIDSRSLDSLQDVVTNLGVLRQEDVGAAVRSSQALFLPTLVESYGLVYLESLVLNRPILTSDRDFARWIAQDFAIYFDPNSAESIVQAIIKLPEFLIAWPQKKSALEAHLSSFPANWASVALNFKQLLEHTLENPLGRRSID